jgi:type II secretory ATPase GspE/PulE/Tfp pilus assembly ATPase PilB-like protein
MVVISEKLKQMIHDREPIHLISEQAKKEGFNNLLQDAYLKATQGLISAADLLSLSYDR